MSTISKNLEPLITHLTEHAIRVGGPFTLRSGAVSDWYLDARQTTFSGEGARLVGDVVLDHLSDDVDAVGGLTMGADPIAMATAISASHAGLALDAFSIRATAKDHGTGGRLVGPVGPGSRVTMLEDTTSTGAALAEAIEVARECGLVIAEALALIDRSGDRAADRMRELGVTYRAIITPSDLGFT